MRLGSPSLVRTSAALFPTALLTATLLICCRLRGVSAMGGKNKGGVKEKRDGMQKVNRELTLVELEAEIRGRAQAGVVDGFPLQVVSGVHVSPKLHQELNQVNVFHFGCMVKGCLMELGGVHVCPC